MTGIVGHRGLLLKAAAVGGGTGWNPADKASTVTLSNSNRTMSAPSGAGNAFSGARGAVSKTAGKLYYEIANDPAVFLGVDGATFFWGIGDSSVTITGANPITGGSPGKWVVYAGSTFQATDAGGAGTYAGAGPNTNATLYVFGLVADFSTRALAFYLNNSLLSTLNWGSGAAAMFPIAWCGNGSVTESLTLRTKASEFTYSPPAGSSAWEP